VKGRRKLTVYITADISLVLLSCAKKIVNIDVYQSLHI